MTEDGALLENSWADRYENARREWSAVVQTQVKSAAIQLDAWARAFASMKQEQDRLIGLGHWRGGPRTLLGALGLEGFELRMTSGLAWLLRPDGHHGLGPAMLQRVLMELGVRDEVDPSLTRVVVEETRGGDTRADLVVYAPTWTIVIEAKVYAVEGPNQLARLHELWSSDPGPSFVFLTRGRRRPRSAGESATLWRNVTWERIAQIGRDAVPGRPTAPGVLDYLTTLEVYHHD